MVFYLGDRSNRYHEPGRGDFGERVHDSAGAHRLYPRIAAAFLRTGGSVQDDHQGRTRGMGRESVLGKDPEPAAGRKVDERTLQLNSTIKQLESSNAVKAEGNASGMYLFNLAVYKTYTIEIGELHISKRDSVNNIVSGLFWFDVRDASGIVHQVSNGRFDFTGQTNLALYKKECRIGAKNFSKWVIGRRLCRWQAGGLGHRQPHAAAVGYLSFS